MHKLKISIFSLLKQPKSKDDEKILLNKKSWIYNERGKHARDDWKEKILEWEIFAVIFYRTLAAYTSDVIKQIWKQLNYDFFVKFEDNFWVNFQILF